MHPDLSSIHAISIFTHSLKTPEDLTKGHEAKGRPRAVRILVSAFVP